MKGQKFVQCMIAAIVLPNGLTAPAIAQDPIFDIDEVAIRGRVVSAYFADFDGDQRIDLMVATLEGIPPKETRAVHVYLQQSDASFPPQASHSIEIPRWSAVYDVADLKQRPGDELVLLRPDGVTILSLADVSATQWHLPVPGPSTVAASDDERGFDPFRMVYQEFDDKAWILVPQIGMVTALAADGTVIAQLEVGRRANYYVAKQSGFLSVESDIQLFLDVPKLSVGDVDGNGSADIVAATRHEIRFFLRDDNGQFQSQANLTLPLDYLSKKDHSRGSGSVVTTARDIDNDNRLDLMITHVEGSFADTVTTTNIFLNHDGEFDIAEPDDRFVSDGAFSSDLLIDIDGDDGLELLRIQLKFSVLEMVEMLLTREVDAQISIHRLQENGRYNEKPWSRKKIGTKISFDTFRPKGFMPTGGVDLNRDGLMDFISSANGKGIEIYLGGEEGPFAKRIAKQKLPTAGVIRFADYDGDELPDFVLYDSQVFDSPIRIGRNTGVLPGTKPASIDFK